MRQAGICKKPTPGLWHELLVVRPLGNQLTHSSITYCTSGTEWSSYNICIYICTRNPDV